MTWLIVCAFLKGFLGVPPWRIPNSVSIQQNKNIYLLKIFKHKTRGRSPAYIFLCKKDTGFPPHAFSSKNQHKSCLEI